MEHSFYPGTTAASTAIRPARLMLALIPHGDWSDHHVGESAQGYLLDQGDPLELLAAIRALTSGDPMRSGTRSQRVSVRRLPNDEAVVETTALSPRETDVLRGLVEGLSYKMVAHKLGISFETVRTYVKRIYEKLRVHNCTEAVAKALKTGLVA